MGDDDFGFFSFGKDFFTNANAFVMYRHQNISQDISGPAKGLSANNYRESSLGNIQKREMRIKEWTSLSLERISFLTIVMKDPFAILFFFLSAKYKKHDICENLHIFFYTNSQIFFFYFWLRRNDLYFFFCCSFQFDYYGGFPSVDAATVRIIASSE